MRVLYLCHRIPDPPNKGDKIRAFHQLRALAAHHEVDLFTLADHREDRLYASELSRYCGEVTVARLLPTGARLRSLAYLASRQPLTLPYFRSASLARHVRAALSSRSYDRVFIYSSAMAQYAEAAEGIPLITDLVDVDSDKWRQYAEHRRFPFSAIYRREGRRLQEYERRICQKATRVIVSTEREAGLLRQIQGTREVHVIPNGVDTAHFAPGLSEIPLRPPTIIFTGAVDYFPNVAAVKFYARSVLPLVRQSVPEARFWIVGSRPVRSVRQLQRLEGVEVTGEVPDVRGYLERARVFVAPLQIAAGIQNKILEALAMELPVVATSRAVQGLTPAVAEIVETGESAEELAQKTVRFLKDGGFLRARGREGRQRVKSEYTWKKSHNQLLLLLENLSNVGERKSELELPVLTSPEGSLSSS